MEGYTLEEMAKVLKIKPDSVLKRLQKAGIEPISRAVLYDKSALKVISNVQMGRPRKAVPETGKPTKKAKK
jgi:Mn-dependent DtxR family transcriptional regulator